MIELLGWVATITLLVGYYTNAHGKRYSWLVWFSGNSAMAVYAYFIGSTSILALSAALMILNLYGYNKWKTDK